jgi:hypothetical protein
MSYLGQDASSEGGGGGKRRRTPSQEETRRWLEDGEKAREEMVSVGGSSTWSFEAILREAREMVVGGEDALLRSALGNQMLVSLFQHCWTMALAELKGRRRHILE